MGRTISGTAMLLFAFSFVRPASRSTEPRTLREFWSLLRIYWLSARWSHGEKPGRVTIL
jgi:hypothetical protein